ncbi:hypothetical protein CBR_g12174 [Chara braunii]|uniref:Retrotransposon gag domain-containing protein n=1 Tax=Chara braunii TaxID=69332 RepID=A0A388KRA5_CHABU|nr:hypothetical protein CBR_g12174 [Chara braunii]|eukprot:GBG72601.1 hypothetical protein CBR_g12174 [Chara braunii]
MALMGDKQRRATDWLILVKGARSRLQEMVEALRSQLGVRPEAVGGAASSGPPYREVMSNMLQIVWELQHLQTEGLMDGQLESLKQCCDDIMEEGQDVYAALEEEFYLHLFETEDEDYTEACTTGSDELQGGRTGVDIALATYKNAIDNNMFVQVRGIDIGIVSLGLSDNNVNNNNNNNNSNNNNNNTSSNHDAGIVGTGKITTVERDTGATCTLDCDNNNSDNDNDTDNNNGKHDTGASDEIVSPRTLDCGNNNSGNDNDINNNDGNHMKNVNIGGLDPLDAALQAAKEIVAKAHREVERIERIMAEAIQRGKTAARQAELLESFEKAKTDGRNSDIVQSLAEWALLESAHARNVSTAWNDRITAEETRLDSMDATLQRLLDAFFRQFPPSPKPSPPPTPPTPPPMTPPPQQSHPETVPTQGPSSGYLQLEQWFPKVTQPEKFTGKDPKVDVSDWIAQMRSYLGGYTCPEVDKVRATLALLAGAALKWETSEANKAQKQLDDLIVVSGLDTIFQDLETRFADKDKASKAADELVRLGQDRNG